MAKSKNEVAVLSKEDLASAGISSQLTQNDLVEVVANDIYDSYMKQKQQLNKNADVLRDELKKFLSPEKNAFVFALQKQKLLPPLEKIEPVSAGTFNEEEDEDEQSYDWKEINISHGTPHKVAHPDPIKVDSIYIEEKGNGSIYLKCNSTTGIYFNRKTPKVKVNILVTYSKTDQTKIDQKDGIWGVIKNEDKREFTKTVEVPVKRYLDVEKRVKEHNENVKKFLSFLPESGGISLDKFIRQARVKMNKAMLKKESPEFRAKMNELFGVNI